MDAPITFRPREVEIFNGVLKLASAGNDLSAITVQEIADAAGMGKGTLYGYFKSREDILKGTITWCVLQELETLEALTDARHEDFERVIEGGLSYVSDLVHNRLARYFLIVTAMQNRQGAALPCPAKMAPQDAVLVQDVLQRYEAMMHLCYEGARKAGLLAAEVDYGYFRHCIEGSLSAYAGNLSRACHPVPDIASTLDEEKLQAYTRRMLLRALA